MKENSRVAVIGLGHFGKRLAVQLADYGLEVLAIDHREEQVEQLRDLVAHTVIANSSKSESLEKLGLTDYDAVVVAIGADFESSLLTVANLQAMGVKSIYARVVNGAHEQILRQMQVDQVIFPDSDSADHLAQNIYITGASHSIRVMKDLVIALVQAPEWTHEKQVKDLNIRSNYDLSVLTCVYPEGENSAGELGRDFDGEVEGMVTGETLIKKTAHLLLFGKREQMRKFMTDL